MLAANPRTIVVQRPAAKLAFWDVKTRGFVVEPGTFEVMAGVSSSDIRARATIEVLPG